MSVWEAAHVRQESMESMVSYVFGTEFTGSCELVDVNT